MDALQLTVGTTVPIPIRFDTDMTGYHVAIHIQFARGSVSRPVTWSDITTGTGEFCFQGNDLQAGSYQAQLAVTDPSGYLYPARLFPVVINARIP